jgi:hypothetical protein
MHGCAPSKPACLLGRFLSSLPQDQPLWFQDATASSLFTQCPVRPRSGVPSCTPGDTACAVAAGLAGCMKDVKFESSAALAASGLLVAPKALQLLRPVPFSASTNGSVSALRLRPSQTINVTLALVDGRGQRISVDLLTFVVSMRLEPLGPDGSPGPAAAHGNGVHAAAAWQDAQVRS